MLLHFIKYSGSEPNRTSTSGATSEHQSNPQLDCENHLRCENVFSDACEFLEEDYFETFDKAQDMYYGSKYEGGTMSREAHHSTALEEAFEDYCDNVMECNGTEYRDHFEGEGRTASEDASTEPLNYEATIQRRQKNTAPKVHKVENCNSARSSPMVTTVSGQ